MREGPRSLLYGCVTHVPMWLPFPGFVTTLRLGAAQDEVQGGFTLRELAPEWEPFHPVIGGAAGTFALKALLLRQPERPQRVGICQYRKFVSRTRASRMRAKGYRVMDVVAKAALPPERLAALLDPGEAPFLVCPPLDLAKEGGTLGQYAAHHHAEDLLRFTAEAVAQGVFTSREGSAFLLEPVLIPGGIELGVYPADFWLAMVTALENVLRECVRRYPLAREGTQGRAWAYCAERFGSFVLLREFRRQGLDSRLGRWSPTSWQRRCAGRMNLIVEEGAERHYRVGN